VTDLIQTVLLYLCWIVVIVRVSALRSRNQRPLWFALLKRFLEVARSDPSRELFAALEESRHPVLSVYARLERATARRSALNLERALAPAFP